VEPLTHLVYLVGPPAVGKLTVAREVERRTGAVVVDNHLVNDPVFVPAGVGRGRGIEGTDALRLRVLDIVMEAAELAPPEVSHVFTHWLPDTPQNAALVERLRSLAGRRGAHFLPVWLEADREVLLRRVVGADRAARAKLRDAEVLRPLLEVPTLPPPPDAVVVDTTDLLPADVAGRIVGRLPTDATPEGVRR
jgi:hypothetical protein